MTSVVKSKRWDKNKKPAAIKCRGFMIEYGLKTAGKEFESVNLKNNDYDK